MGLDRRKKGIECSEISADPVKPSPKLLAGEHLRGRIQRLS